MLFHFDFSLIALIGIILLIGIVKKNGIMLVDFALVAERDDHLSAHDAVRRAALLRFRPIMMTTMAAMLGGMPLMLGTGTGSELRQPLGCAIVGGLLVSQALTLFTTPVVYIYLDQLSDWISNWRTQTSNLEPQPQVYQEAVPITPPAAHQCDLGQLRLLRRFAGLIRIFVNQGRPHLTAARRGRRPAPRRAPFESLDLGQTRERVFE